jgi:hypothetical protein
VREAQPAGVIVSTPYLRVRVAQRAPYLPSQPADPQFGEWLDVYLTMLAPLPAPVGGVLGEGGAAGAVRGARVAAAQPRASGACPTRNGGTWPGIATSDC